MESGNASVYIMLMTVVFYTTGSICALRLATWLATHALFPILSRILSHCYSLAATSAVSKAPRGLPTLSKADSRNSKVGDAAVGLFFKLVRIATGFVPVPLAGRPLHGAKIAESIASGRTTLLARDTLVLFSVFVCACSIAVAYPYFAMV